MHIAMLAARRQTAADAITSSAEFLGNAYNVHVAPLQRAGARDPQVAELFRLETVAELLGALVVAHGGTTSFVNPNTAAVPTEEEGDTPTEPDTEKEGAEGPDRERPPVEEPDPEQPPVEEPPVEPGDESQEPVPEDGFTEAQKEALKDAKLDTVEKIREATDDELAAVTGIGPATIRAYREALTDWTSNGGGRRGGRKPS